MVKGKSSSPCLDEIFLARADKRTLANRCRSDVQFLQQEEPVSKNRDRPTGDAKPTRTLFVINFDPLRTKIRDIEKHFEPYGKILNIRIRKNFAFVRYETVGEASAAVKKTDKRYAFVSYVVLGHTIVCTMLRIRTRYCT